MALSDKEEQFFKRSLLRESLKEHWKIFLSENLPSNNDFSNWENSSYITKSFDCLYDKFIKQLPFFERERKINNFTYKYQIQHDKNKLKNH